MMMNVVAPVSAEELVARAEQLAGICLQELAELAQQSLPSSSVVAKGWIGRTLELVLGADAGTLSVPDFTALGIELKTIPVNSQLRPQESTYICHINLQTLQQEPWQTSSLFNKLKKVLWIPIETEPELAFGARRLGSPLLWQPDAKQELLLRTDWMEFAELIGQGRIESITAHQGTVLQIRPKAANKHALCQAINEHGETFQTLPRGFYLRASFTQQIIQQYFY
jgi:DNA mismatch repair protein MutH